MSYSYDEIWARFYDGINPGLEGDAAFYAELARDADGPVLELGCGNGRVLFPVAAATDHPVTGLDLSEPMLAQCRAHLAEQAEAVQKRTVLMQGDMTEFTLDDPVALVLIPYRVFQHLLTVEAQESCLASVRRALAPGGLVCIDCFDPRFHMVASEGRRLDAVPLPRVDFADAATGHAVHVATAWREWDPEQQTFGELWTFTEFDGDTVVGEYEAILRLRYAFRFELQHLWHRAGFEVEALYGDFARGPFTYGGEQVWMLRPA